MPSQLRAVCALAVRGGLVADADDVVPRTIEASVPIVTAVANSCRLSAFFMAPDPRDSPLHATSSPLKRGFPGSAEPCRRTAGDGEPRLTLVNGTLPWDIARSAGLMAWALLTASVVLGLTMSSRVKPFGRRPRPAWTLDFHRYLGGLATIFTGVHVVAVLADNYINLNLL